MSDLCDQLEKGWYPDPSGSARLRLWDGKEWTIHYADPPRARSTSSDFWRDRLTRRRVAVAILWVLLVTFASVAALIHRPAFAEVQTNAWIALAIGSVPGVVLAIVVIRTPGIFVTTAVVSCAWSMANAWYTMRTTFSTGAVGVLVTSVVGLVIVAIGCGVDGGWRFGKRFI